MNIPLSRTELSAYLERANAPKSIRADILNGTGAFLDNGKAVFLNVGPAADQAKKDEAFVRERSRRKSASPVARVAAKPAAVAAKTPAKTEPRTAAARAASALRPPSNYREGDE